ncbi:MAG TPA: M24 family metallopeptidase [Tepidisphaeraceae bacterium]|nr:M24 family metallopeptidase [Tepidisphaeraceae bacterium]
MPTEPETKSQRLSAFLDRHGLDGALLTLRSNFAWITGGRDNHIANNSPVGVASILATKDGNRLCLANRIEAPRMSGEELVGTGIETVEFSWHDHDSRQRAVREVIGGRKIAADSETFGLPLPHLPGDFNELRWSLTPEEIERYRDGGRRAAAAMERACRAITPGISEHEAAGLLDHEMHAAEMNPLVTLVSSDERLPRYRHPIPTARKIRNYVMLVTCAERGGLISCLTRFVRFAPPTAEERAKQQAIANIDAAVNLATRPGRTLGEIFDDLRRAYAANGHDGEWENHHQGGSCGYQPRDVVAVPGSGVRALANQAFAWNPSIVGAKCEDTVLCTDAGIEVLTAHSAQWPTTTGQAGNGQTLRRADVLVAA